MGGSRLLVANVTQGIRALFRTFISLALLIQLTVRLFSPL